MSNDEVVEGIITTVLLHGMYSNCSHTHRSSGHCLSV